MKNLQLREISDGWGDYQTHDLATHYIDVGTHRAAIAVAADSPEEAKELAQDIIIGLSKITRMEIVNKYGVKE